MRPRTLRIGAGAGFSGDRIEPALELLERGELQYLAFECLAERTIGLAQEARQRDPDRGFDPLLDDRLSAALPIARRRGVRIVSNMGAANPAAAARRVAQIARAAGLSGYRAASVLGDDVVDVIRGGDFALLDREGSSRDLLHTMVSANAYLGVEGIVEALRRGADTVITGRVCDPALFLAPLVYEFGWSLNDWPLLGQGTLVGHLLECAGQLCGGYFADPGFKEVPDLANLGFPFADVSRDGSAVFGKLAGTGGLLNAATCREQLLYEILNPESYLQADVTADFSRVRIDEVGLNQVRVSGALGRAPSGQVKVSIGYEDGYVGEGQISYAGPGASARGELALQIVRDRLRIVGAKISDLRLELIGINSVDRRLSRNTAEPREVRIRVAGRADCVREAERIGAEVEALYTNGPAGGGGATRSVRKVLAVASTLIDRELVAPIVQIEEA